MPKKRPTLVATVKPATTLQSGTVEGRLGTKVRVARLSGQLGSNPDYAARRSDSHGFEQELPDDIAAARTHRLAHADLPRALSHRYQHDIHYANPAHQQADGRDYHHHQTDRADHLPELRDHRFGTGDAEIIRVGRLHVAAPAEQLGHFVFRLFHLARPDQDADEVIPWLQDRLS